MWLNEFKSGDIVGDEYNDCFEIKQVFNTGNVKIKVINLDSIFLFKDVKGYELKKDKTYVIDPDYFEEDWKLIEQKKSEIVLDKVESIKNRISNVKKELELAELELKNISENKSEIDVTKNLIPGCFYKIIDSDCDGDIYFGFFVRKLDYNNDGYDFEFLVKYNDDHEGQERISKRWFSKKELNKYPPELIDTTETKLMGKYVVGFFNSYSVETKEQ